MNHLDTARTALREQIRALVAEQTRLEQILFQLNEQRGERPAAPSRGLGEATDAVAASKRRGRGRPRKHPAPKPGDVDGVLDLIKAAGKDGVNAIGLAFKIKQAGLAKPSKAELLESGKVKASGKGGGIVYKFVG